MTREPVVRDAAPDDVAGICLFGATHIRPHYAPLIGALAADAQVRRWWSEPAVSSAVAHGLVAVAVHDDRVVGVGQRGRDGGAHVIYKLYVEPGYRGRRLGPRLISALVRQLPADARTLHVEQFAANERAAAFYEREGFAVERVVPDPDGHAALDVVWRVRDLGT